jgi:hypothetical protein
MLSPYPMSTQLPRGASGSEIHSMMDSGGTSSGNPVGTFIQGVCQLPDGFLPNGALAVFHFGDVPLWNTGEPRKLLLREPLLASCAFQHGSGSQFIRFETFTPRNGIGDIHKAHGIKCVNCFLVLSGGADEAQFHVLVLSTALFHECPHKQPPRA